MVHVNQRQATPNSRDRKQVLYESASVGSHCARSKVQPRAIVDGKHGHADSNGTGAEFVCV